MFSGCDALVVISSDALIDPAFLIPLNLVEIGLPRFKEGVPAGEETIGGTSHQKEARNQEGEDLKHPARASESRQQREVNRNKSGEKEDSRPIRTPEHKPAAARGNDGQCGRANEHPRLVAARRFSDQNPGQNPDPKGGVSLEDATDGFDGCRP
jgi:hypothetical protein